MLLHKYVKARGTTNCAQNAHSDTIGRYPMRYVSYQCRRRYSSGKLHQSEFLGDVLHVDHATNDLHRLLHVDAVTKSKVNRAKFVLTRAYLWVLQNRGEF